MLSAILGKKVGMTQVYDASGVIHPVTVVQAGPCSVLQVKAGDSDGYSAIQLGFDDVKPRRATGPEIGHAGKANSRPKRFIREVRLADGQDAGLQIGSTVTVEAFEGVKMVDIIGTSKGKGYQGVMKLHHFTGQPASHGTERKHRSPGSIGAHGTNRGWGGDIKRGKRMAGRMGGRRRSNRNQLLVSVDKENNLLLIEGSVPGANGGYLLITASKKKVKVKTQVAAPAGKAKAKK
jgi:large subunit ribosomal protein L3